MLNKKLGNDLCSKLWKAIENPFRNALELQVQQSIADSLKKTVDKSLWSHLYLILIRSLHIPGLKTTNEN